MRLSNAFCINLVIVFYISVVLCTSCNNSSTEQYGFLAKLGTDTISVESVTRQGNTITSDEVDRFPRVQVRHTVIDLNPDGSIKHLVMDIRTPSESPNQRARKVKADIANNKVLLTKTDGSGTLRRAFATGGALVVAHVPQMYSLYEIYFATAMKQAAALKTVSGTPVQLRQFYIDREFDHFPLGRATVTPLENGSIKISHDWLSGIGEAKMDSGYHMLSYSGDRTTYKVAVSRLNSQPDIKSIAERFEAKEIKSGNVTSLSVRDTTQAKIGNGIFTIDYARPLMRGRKLLGEVISFDRVWRTGANAATQFTTSIPVKLAGMRVPAGTYTLWTIPHTDSVELIINKQTGQWGTDYNRSKNLGIARIASQTVTTPVEAFTISITPVDAKHGTLVFEWGYFKWTAQIEL